MFDLLVIVIPSVPLSKASQTFSQTCAWLKAKVLFKWGRVGIGHWHIAGLHRNELLVGFKVVILGEDSCMDEFFLKDGDEVEEVLGGVVAYVIYFIWWDRESVFALLLLRCVLHDADHSFHDVIDVGEVALAVAVVEDLDGFAFHQFVGEAEVSHVGTTCWTIDCEETETGGWDVVEFAVGVRHQFVALLCCSVEADGVVHLVVCGVRYFLVAAIDG